MPETIAIELGLAKVAEAPLLARISRDYIERGLNWRWQPGQIRRLIQDPETVALCARTQPLRRHDLNAPVHYKGGDVLGFGIMTYGLEKAHLMLLAVLPRARRRNIASKLLDWLEKTAVTAGVSRIELEVRAGNIAARSFYRERGYHERDYLAGYYSGQESAFRMARNLRKS
ncbi:MAG TPA: GNAT family N-acetyltransferase [Pseudomonadales bacterium]